jgi:uncharacterized membrane protein YphA (DoxX/SURF4 family)
LVEQLTLNQRVQGSSPCAPTNPFQSVNLFGIRAVFIGELERVSSRVWTEERATLKAKVIGYWIATAILVFSIGSSGLAELAHLQGNVEGVVQVLGYPSYFLTILGIWKLLGAIAIAVPRFPRLKEWAYAGIFFNVTGAAASHIVMRDYGIYAFHVLVNLFLAVLVLVSWALRPQSRTSAA